MAAPTPLHAAIWAGDVGSASAILAGARQDDVSADVATVSAAERPLHELLEARDAHGNSALHLAVRVVQPAQRSLVQLLLVRAAFKMLRSRCC